MPRDQGIQRLLIGNGTPTPEGKVNQETANSPGWELGPKTNAEWIEMMGQLSTS